MSNIFYPPRIQSLPFSELYFRVSGTSTPQPVYTDEDLGVAHADPVVADSNGYFDKIYLDPSLPDYRVIHTRTGNGAQIWPTQDDIPSSSNVSSGYRVKGIRPRITIEETDAIANNGKWYVEAQGGSLIVGQMDDAESSLTPLVTIPRGTVLQVAPLSSSGAALNISSLQVGHTALIFKTSGTARTSTTTPALDPVLQFNGAPAGTYHTEGVILYDANTAGDFVLNWPRASSPAGSLIAVSADYPAFGVSNVYPFNAVMQGNLTGVPAGVVIGVTVNGTEGATAGQTLGPEWCQGSSNVNATTVRAGSWLKVTRLT